MALYMIFQFSMIWLMWKIYFMRIWGSFSLILKCTALFNKPFLAKPTLIDLTLDKLHYYEFVVNLGRCDGSLESIYSCAWSTWSFVPNRPYNKNCNLNQKWNNQRCWCECKNQETKNILRSLFLKSKNKWSWVLTKM